MKKSFSIGFALLVLFTTFNSKKELSINQLKVKEIIIKNNEILSEEELIKHFSFLYNKNMVFLNAFEINKKLEKKSFIKKLKIKKTYPNRLEIIIIEKEPIAIIIKNKKKFFLDKNIQLIEYRKDLKYINLPIIYGEIKNFKKLFFDMKKNNFPIEMISKYYFYDAKRWDIEMKDKKIIKLPSKNYRKSLNNFISIQTNKNFEKYKIFDYRLNGQLILK